MACNGVLTSHPQQKKLRHPLPPPKENDPSNSTQLPSAY